MAEQIGPHTPLYLNSTDDLRPRRFWANSRGDIYEEDPDGRVFRLPCGGFLQENGLPDDPGLTEYVPKERPV